MTTVTRKRSLALPTLPLEEPLLETLGPPAVKCPQCQKDVCGDRGLIQHVRQSHPKKDGRANREPKVFCGVCGHGLGSMKSLDAHGYQQHHGDGRARKEWLKQPTTIDGAEMAQVDTRTEVFPGGIVSEVTTPDEPPPESAHGETPFPTRHFPPKEDRNNAATLAGLPWLTFPTTVEQCDDVLNGIAIGVERTQISTAFWLSLRNYITALRKRLSEKVAA